MRKCNSFGHTNSEATSIRMNTFLCLCELKTENYINPLYSHPQLIIATTMGNISPTTIIAIIGLYFSLLMVVSWFTSRKADTETFFTAKRSSPWLLVAIGMIGASLSGVTFISLPGAVGAPHTYLSDSGDLLYNKNVGFSWMQMVIGFLIGYFVIATVLLPIYYKLGVSTIYSYLGDRFGPQSHKTGSAFFILSRVVGAAFRLFLVAIVLQEFLMDPLGVSFFWTVLITIVLIWVYTFSGGIKTIVVTDTLQTVCMLGAVIMTIYYIMQGLNTDFSGMVDMIQESQYSKMFYFDTGWVDPNNFYKQIISGALMAIVMTGLDQDMMQKNLTCKTLGESQKNIFTFSFILIFANILFLSLGALLYIYASKEGIEFTEVRDQIYPTIALNHLPSIIGIVFILGLIAAAYSSADSALTALTTTFCLDFLDFGKKERSESLKRKTRLIVHVGFSLVLLVTILLAKQLEETSIINQLFTFAGYTYGPILGLFAFGILTKRLIKDNLVVPICIIAPIISYFINTNSVAWLGGFTFGHTIIALNGFITLIGLWVISSSREPKND